MVENIKELEHPDRFPGTGCSERRWALCSITIAISPREQAIEFSSVSRKRLSQYLSEDHDDGLNRAIRKELSETIVDAIARLRLTHRNVLMLRCFEQLSFAEIGEVMGCKELRARVLFFRARHSLSRQLSRRGLGKGLLVAALGVFGALTAPARQRLGEHSHGRVAERRPRRRNCRQGGTPSGVAWP